MVNLKMMKRLLLGFLLFWGLAGFAQEPQFYREIQAFKRQDSIKFPPKKAILFVGSSTFTNWKDVADYFPGKTIINRGFGGSSLPHVIQYAPDIIYPYHAKQIVIYCGENDFTGNASAAQVVERVQTLVNNIRKVNKKARITYVSIKPSPSRLKYIPAMKEANAAIEAWLKTKKNTSYINTADAMYEADGKLKAEIFMKDELHMNAKGYVIWQKIMAPYLL